MKNWIIDDDLTLHNLDHYYQIKYEDNTIKMFFANQTKGVLPEDDFIEYVISNDAHDRLDRFHTLRKMIAP